MRQGNGILRFDCGVYGRENNGKCFAEIGGGAPGVFTNPDWICSSDDGSDENSQSGEAGDLINVDTAKSSQYPALRTSRRLNPPEIRVGCPAKWPIWASTFGLVGLKSTYSFPFRHEKKSASPFAPGIPPGGLCSHSGRGVANGGIGRRWYGGGGGGNGGLAGSRAI